MFCLLLHSGKGSARGTDHISTTATTVIIISFFFFFSCRSDLFLSLSLSPWGSYCMRIQLMAGRVYSGPTKVPKQSLPLNIGVETNNPVEAVAGAEVGRGHRE